MCGWTQKQGPSEGEGGEAEKGGLAHDGLLVVGTYPDSDLRAGLSLLFLWMKMRATFCGRSLLRYL